VGSRQRSRGFRSSRRGGHAANRTRVKATERERDSFVETQEPLEADVVASVRDGVACWLEERTRQHRSGPEAAFLYRLSNRITLGELGLPHFPDVPLRLDRLLKRADPDPRQVLDAVKRDPELVRLIWACAGSTRFAKPPRSLQDAVTRVGLDTVWRLGVQQALQAVMFEVPRFHRQVQDVRRHGLICAELASLVTGQARGPAYLGGLLHDLGKLLIYRDTVLPARLGRPDEGLVDQALQHIHAPLGLLAVNEWGLGAGITVGVGFHHSPGEAPVKHKTLARALFLADQAAHLPSLPEDAQPLAALRLRNATPSGTDVDQLLTQAARLHRSMRSAA